MSAFSLKISYFYENISKTNIDLTKRFLNYRKFSMKRTPPAVLQGEVLLLFTFSKIKFGFHSIFVY